MKKTKSRFGITCASKRGRLSEQDMGREIENLGYKLGKDLNSNKQPVISQFEHELDGDEAKRKQHRDPPLDYVETCATLFKLSKVEEYGLFIDALMSSETIAIDAEVLDGVLKEDIIKVIAALVLSNSELKYCVEKEKSLRESDKAMQYCNFMSSNKKLLDAWKTVVKSSQEIVNEIKYLAYKKNNNTEL